MEIKDIIEMVETRFLPLSPNIDHSFDLKFGDLHVNCNRTHIHIYYRTLTPNQFTLIAYPEWTSVQFCPDHLTEDDIMFIYAALDNIYENHIKGSKLLLSKGEQLTNKIQELQNELQEWQNKQN
ncbi:hypothetical protein ACS126_01620 [Sphingobacterium lactis]|uniref:hypothetical protein n=1 Tax=Sphingobacterium lactis TaxID=797291 RepID=UPI003EC794B7